MPDSKKPLPSQNALQLLKVIELLDVLAPVKARPFTLSVTQPRYEPAAAGVVPVPGAEMVAVLVVRLKIESAFGPPHA